MTHRSNPPRTFQATSPDVSPARMGLTAATVPVLVLITVQPGAGIGFA